MLRYGQERFEITDGGERELAEHIETKVRERGGWVDVPTAGGTTKILISAGIPIWLSTSVEHAAADRVETTYAGTEG